MIPLRDVIPSRTTPYITVTIISLNAFAWVYELVLPPEELTRFLQAFGVVPAQFQPPTLITSMFLHGSWSHVVGNMWYLWIFGDNVEDRVGHVRFAAFYLLCGLVAAVGQIVMDPDAALPMIGASGAIAGVMGAYFVLYPRSRVLTLIPLVIFWEVIEVPAIVLLGFWFLMQLFSAGAIAVTASTAGGIAFTAHVAGFLSGVVGIYVFRQPRRREGYWA
ncbi:MAG TPA: rhomboid family intramembrane serine protease [Vicinamibacterales bacterium]|jgi:membrane associated rhomboid family serine protease|nr:rhomboid family intramembrane serine protease [Vicinamibacterales bacterium]